MHGKPLIFLAGSGDKQRVLEFVAEGIEWIVLGERWPLAGTHRAHAELQ